jgi:hypothetical protein
MTTATFTASCSAHSVNVFLSYERESNGINWLFMFTPYFAREEIFSIIEPVTHLDLRGLGLLRRKSTDYGISNGVSVLQTFKF